MKSMVEKKGEYDNTDKNIPVLYRTRAQTKKNENSWRPSYFEKLLDNLVIRDLRNIRPAII